MALNATLIRSRPEDVFDVLLDPAAYPNWVVGTKRVEHVDPTWPSPGSSFGVVFVGTARKDRTRLIDLQRPSRLVLQPHVRPFGATRVEIHLERRGSGTRLSLYETVWPRSRARPIRWIADVLLYVRNVVGLRRFRRLVEPPAGT